MATQTPTKSTAPLGSTARTNQLLSEASKQTGVKAPTFSESPITSQTKAIQSSQGGAVVGGRLIGAGGVDLGAANSADVQGAGSPRVSPQTPITPQAGTEQLDPNAEASPEMVAQATGLQNQVNTLASQKGLTLTKNAQGQYTATPDLSSQYNQVKQTLDQSGVNPVTGGQGANAVQTALKQVGSQAESPSVWSTIYQDEPNIEKPALEYDELMSPLSQRTSLVDEYKNMSKSLGLDEINTDLIDAKRVIEGTEDDVRNEITSAGGTATESQVMAMSNARNKQLIKNYNTLLDTKNATMTQLSTMMSLSIQDRNFAEAEFDRKLNYAWKIAEFKERATTNARQTYLSLIEKGMGSSLLTDPYQTSLVEKTLGISKGGLASVVSKQAQSASLDQRYKEAQIANIYSEIDKREYEMSPVNGIDEKTMAKIQSAPEYKTINGVLPAMNAVKTYLDAVKNTGSFEILSGTKSGELKSSYGNAIAAWKTLAALGALSGADFGLAENVIPEPSLFTRNSKVKAQLESAVDNAIGQAEIMTKRLGQNYPKASTLLNQQLDDMRVVAYPDKYTYGDDGLVYEIK